MLKEEVIKIGIFGVIPKVYSPDDELKYPVEFPSIVLSQSVIGTFIGRKEVVKDLDADV